MTVASVSDQTVFDTLKTTFGYTTFRPLQHDIVRTVVDGGDVFVLMPTGGGKSLCYQLPALIRDGVTVVVSPLIALMKDQVDALRELGVHATYINSSLNLDEVERRLSGIAAGRYRLVYVAPERLMLPGFLKLLSTVQVAGFAIDEAHCISEWGHDFRPEYRGLKRLRELFPGVPLSAYTATATARVQADIRSQLGLEHAPLFQGSFNRPNLYYAVRPKRDGLDQVLTYLRAHPGASGIIYRASRKKTEELATELRANGFGAEAYHAGLTPEQRRTRQERFVRDDVPIIVATIAFGMGIDKPDVRFVIHYDLPKTLEGYYQESGRAGRDGEPSDCILFYSPADVVVQRRWAEEKETPQERAIALKQLQAMSSWATGTTCRRSDLLGYFDETFAGQDGPCCDICTEPPDQEDATVPAQMFLSCVKRTGERFGVGHVVDVLRGSRSEKVLRFRHNELSTYGIGKDRDPDQWRFLAHELIRRGYLRQDEEAFNAVKLQPSAADILFNGAPFTVAKRAEEEERQTPDSGVAFPELFERLRALRKRLADDQGIPPYFVFGDTALRHMATSLPQTESAFLEIHGVGYRKNQEYGPAFLREIVAYAQETGAVAAGWSRPRRRSGGDGRLNTSQRETLALHRRGLSLQDIAHARLMATSTIAKHLVTCMEAGEDIHLDTIVSPDRRIAIEQAMTARPDASFTEIREALGEECSFEELRLVRAGLRRRMDQGV